MLRRRRPDTTAFSLPGARFVCRRKQAASTVKRFGQFPNFAIEYVSRLSVISKFEPAGVQDQRRATAAGGSRLPEVELMPSGILLVRWPPNATIEVPEALAAISRIEQLSGNVPRPLLVEMRGMRYASSAALKKFARALTATRMALVGTSPVEQTIGHFFQAIHRPSYPASYFTQYAEALDWLAAVEAANRLTPPSQFPPRSRTQR
ncbi:STAS/SEC14 domain-containing protein [Arthrobacter sp. Sa2BUA2]|uniref:STAS/SEC14 domain-containing protein n=1 Tax=Arthrobacter pullicola TaxID=2762224 RepID=A0ABR8YIN0_9MICC|nr:STAS/SEC14 domain-containing protein [Arthrobacter pullicola]MBD8044091.1 STAS/SEC14 domain-containing protein [Arthrobacter pullicola]